MTLHAQHLTPGLCCEALSTLPGLKTSIRGGHPWPALQDPGFEGLSGHVGLREHLQTRTSPNPPTHLQRHTPTHRYLGLHRHTHTQGIYGCRAHSWTAFDSRCPSPRLICNRSITSCVHATLDQVPHLSTCTSHIHAVSLITSWTWVPRFPTPPHSLTPTAKAASRCRGVRAACPACLTHAGPGAP